MIRLHLLVHARERADDGVVEPAMEPVLVEELWREERVAVAREPGLARRGEEGLLPRRRAGRAGFDV